MEILQKPTQGAGAIDVGATEADPSPMSPMTEPPEGWYSNGPIPRVGASILEGLSQRRTASELAFENQLGDKKHPNYIAGDLVYEHLAWRFAYKDSLSPEDEDWLRVQGFRAGKTVHGVQGFAMMSFIPLAGHDRPPVLAFRGTDDLKDLADDLNPMGVGMYQLAANEGAIATALAALQGHGLTTVTGHSLGGALAQLAAARFPGMVNNIVTFQAPGISKKMSGRIEAVNKASVEAGKEPLIKSHHFSIKDDLVSTAGETHTPGEQTQIDLPGVNFFLKHGGNKEAGNYATKASMLSCAKIEPTSAQVDSVRAGVGKVLAMVGGLTGEGDRTPYIEVWEKVRAALDNNASFDQVSAIISGASLPSADKSLMLTNLSQIRDAHTGPIDRDAPDRRTSKQDGGKQIE